ncbi:phosphatase PAP2 family protein [Pandoraea sp.]|uniref:phosphatase PAP2 family protein n=1 Tax=Pandoraea sp. TaxID=1883445 RepID=UPI001227287B|nr:phosphatase PAP2 family protein [Pandoraea sp.]TAL55559.1 MAG: phosphatase PAP2 family protein [Pandoraea sp.]TAM20112.1 MAG: phosphatase PAP2 family protein [Pandoraea sp.]
MPRFAERRALAWLLSFLVCAVLVGVCIRWLDRPLSGWVHRTTYGNPLVIRLSQIPDPLFVLAWPGLLLAGGVSLWRHRFDGAWASLALCSGSVALVEFIKNGLKVIAGRTWPETWINNNPSFIRDGAFGFHWFAGWDRAYASFPSGHLSVMLACASVLWLRHPRLRWLYLLAIVLTAIGQLGANYHWLSDVIAGAFLGAATGCFTVWLARRQARA